MSQQNQPHPETVLTLLTTGEWGLSRQLADPTMTDEYNNSHGWYVTRNTAPFADKDDNRHWFGPTAYDAFVSAHTALFGDTNPLPRDNKQLREAQLGLYFSIGATAMGDEAASERQHQCYQALEALLKSRGMTELAVQDREGDFRYMPFELCECEWDGDQVEGQFVYSVWIHSSSAFEPSAAKKLRDMALEAYVQVCGKDAQFVRAEMYQKWGYSTTTPYLLDN